MIINGLFYKKSLYENFHKGIFHKGIFILLKLQFSNNQMSLRLPAMMIV